MCTTRILARSSMGLIVECSECNSIQLNFGTGQMAFKSNRFDRFVEDIVSKVQSNDFSSHPKTKTIMLSHPDYAGFSFVLTFSELTTLMELTHLAQLMRETYNILTVQ